MRVRSLTLSVAVAPDTVRLAFSAKPVAKPVKVPAYVPVAVAVPVVAPLCKPAKAAATWLAVRLEPAV